MHNTYMYIYTQILICKHIYICTNTCLYAYVYIPAKKDKGLNIIQGIFFTLRTSRYVYK